ncbi:WhiB family transcriptional regulator [Lentzea sp. CC55]|nr:WhiB family transcriptional regulator [Lentzea sp. CC55]MCG8922603.1 WhiB family transcriptional regulator [Lentzea sp. CC55]
MAKAICRRFPVMGKCRTHALEVHETSGIGADRVRVS